MEYSIFVTNVVKHVVKGEKWACSTLKAGKNKPVLFIAKIRDFKRFCEEIKEKRGFVMNPRFGLSVRSGATEWRACERPRLLARESEVAGDRTCVAFHRRIVAAYRLGTLGSASSLLWAVSLREKSPFRRFFSCYPTTPRVAVLFKKLA